MVCSHTAAGRPRPGRWLHSSCPQERNASILHNHMMLGMPPSTAIQLALELLKRCMPVVQGGREGGGPSSLRSPGPGPWPLGRACVVVLLSSVVHGACTRVGHIMLQPCPAAHACEQSLYSMRCVRWLRSVPVCMQLLHPHPRPLCCCCRAACGRMGGRGPSS